MTFGELMAQHRREREAAHDSASPMQSALAPATQAEAAPAAAAAPSEAPSRSGFTLPDLDPNDPDYEEYKKVHDAFQALDTHFTKAVPDIDFQGHYRQIADEMKKAPTERHLNPLSKFAIALGTQNPEDPYAPNLGLAQAEATSKGNLARETSEFEKTLDFKKEALSGQIRQLMAQGDFRKALALAEQKAKNDITSERIKSERDHSHKMKEIEAGGTVKKDVARINATAAMDRVDRRITAAKERGNGLKLSPTDKSQMNAEIERAMTQFRMAIAKDPLTGERPDPEDVDDAEEKNRQELIRIHDYWEDREIGDRPANAGPVGSEAETPEEDAGENGEEVETPRGRRPSGKAWKAAGQTQTP